MRKRVLLTVISALAGVILLVMPSIGSADPELADVGLHTHYLVETTPEGITYLAQIGPNFCDKAVLQNAHNQFHNNVHRAETGSTGGPAAGLHNGTGPEIVSRGCTFVPPES